MTFTRIFKYLKQIEYTWIIVQIRREKLIFFITRKCLQPPLDSLRTDFLKRLPINSNLLNAEVPGTCCIKLIFFIRLYDSFLSIRNTFNSALDHVTAVNVDRTGHSRHL